MPKQGSLSSPLTSRRLGSCREICSLAVHTNKQFAVLVAHMSFHCSFPSAQLLLGNGYDVVFDGVCAINEINHLLNDFLSRLLGGTNGNLRPVACQL